MTDIGAPVDVLSFEHILAQRQLKNLHMREKTVNYRAACRFGLTEATAMAASHTGAATNLSVLLP
jgi:hypothetical protein